MIKNPADGAEIFFDDDSADGEPILYLHGSALSRSIWRGLGYTKTLGAGYRNIRMDLRGHGRSYKSHDVADYTMDKVMGDIHALLDHLGLEAVHVVGYSFGARTGLHLAMTSPASVLSLIMLGGTFEITPGEIGKLFFPGYLQALRAGDIEGFVTGQETRGRLDPATRMAFKSNDPLALAAYYEAAETVQNVELAELAQIRVPTLLLIGTRDQPRFDQNKIMAHTLPNARMVALPGRTHGNTLFPIEPVVQAIESFWKGRRR
ncbi:alpha/beta hydrolase [Glutamicibacter protophormiae]|uniref:alpha/beta fold hydrolase n=1 Tax=Glutamicibacter protophormiae TaxID=37930 RepID=UPI002A7FC9E8|nr:alpha/beta hydrolase [Glutamicibacter protophormiae]WPR63972.1 alpha/beta hydrolase [Glutamicibacter protophormiae]WPR67467.1 alpha/beta hydrolase [Glutamicibacter protophormiae]